MAEDTVARTFGGSCAENRKIIRLIVASPVHLVRDGLAATLRYRADVIVVGVVDLDPRCIAKIAEAQPDVMLVDLGQTDPAAAARMIKAVSGGTRLVAFALDETDDHVFACAAAGFCGYVARESGADELHRTLVTPLKAACTACRTLQQRCSPALPAYCRADQQEPLPALSSRESEILALVEQGRSNKEIARQLAISSPPSRITYTAFYRDCRSADAAKPPPGCVSRTTAEPRFILQ